jgi:hypothetical protein
VSILCEDTVRPLDLADGVVGLGAGITSLLTLSRPIPGVSDAEGRVANPRHERADRVGLARAVCDASWRQVRTMLEYKAQRYGRQLVVVDRWFPSSKLCSACGTSAQVMPLEAREWVCACGAVHDRDVNAARNVLAAGPAER